MPVKNKNWLLQFINEREIGRFFKYSETLNAHVFTYMGTDGRLFWEARGVEPKTVTSGGPKPMMFLGSGTDLVVVEDLVSAIKISRQFLAMPLFGASMRNDWIAAIGRNRTVKRIFYWLDDDKKKEAVEYTRKSSLFMPSRAIFTELDPKEYSDEEIKEFLAIP